jgi:hypothetical protein
MTEQKLEKLRTRYQEKLQDSSEPCDRKTQAAFNRAKRAYLRALDQLQHRFTFEVDDNAEPRIYE